MNRLELTNQIRVLLNQLGGLCDRQQQDLAAKDKRIEELEKSLAEEKRECVEGWRRWKILKDKP